MVKKENRYTVFGNECVYIIEESDMIRAGALEIRKETTIYWKKMAETTIGAITKNDRKYPLKKMRKKIKKRLQFGIG